MTNKPFEVQDDTIILNGVNLQVTEQGAITVEGNPVAGGGSSIQNGDNAFIINSDADVVFTGDGPGNAVNRGILWDYGAEQGGVDSGIRQDGSGLTIRSYTEDFNNSGTPVNIKTNAGDYEKTWVFDPSGNLILPDGLGNITNPSGPINLVTNDYAQLQWTTPLGLDTADPNDTDEPKNWLYVESGGVFIETNLNTGGTDRQWSFNNNGDLTLPEGGDILDSNGDSVLGGGTPTIPNTIKGFIDLVGNKPNNDDDVWFESVVVNGQYAYVLGGDWLVNGSSDLTKVYKFDLETGNQVWVKQIIAGNGAQFNFNITSEVITITGIPSTGGNYKAGEELYFYGYRWGGNTITNLITVVVDTVDEDGAILTASIKPGYNLTGINDQDQTNQIADNDNAKGGVSCITYDTVNNKLVAVSEFQSGQGDDFDNYWTWTNIYIVNPTTGIVEQTKSLSAEGDIFANAVKINPSNGKIAISGEKYGEFRQFGTLTLLQGYNGYFDVLKSEMDTEHYPGGPYDWYGDFWVSGTDIVGMNNVDNVNYYENLATTVREGSGAQFTITVAANVYSLNSIASEGTNYRVGHKISILGTSLGGSTPTDDLVITIDSVGVNGNILTASITSGTSSLLAGGPFTLSGTNYQTGSGAQVVGYVNPETGVFNINYFSNQGTGYVVGDVITVAGTNFANGASPANDLTAVVSEISGGGIITNLNSFDMTGTAPTNAIRVYVNGVDFTVDGTWSMKQNLGGEAFVYTPDWTNAIGGPSGDRFYDLCWSQDGASIFTVGRGRYETNYDQALVVKFNATTGAVVWGKDIRFTEAATNNREARAVCLAPGSSDLIVVGAWYNSNDPIYEDELIVTRITEDGVAVWQKTYLFNDNGNNRDIDYEFTVKVLGNNIVIGFEASTPQHSRGIGYLIIDGDGIQVDHRILSADGNSNYNYYNTPCSQKADVYTDANGDDYFIGSGYTYVPTDNYYNALWFKLPLDGYKPLNAGQWTSLGEHILGKYEWSVTGVTSAFDSFTATEHVNTITTSTNQRNYETTNPSNQLPIFKFDITDDSAGYLEFGDGSKQSFATDKIPQIPAANDYYLTEQDSGKHIFFESENGRVYIPHWTVKNLPVGFTFTIVNTTGSNCYVECDGDVVGDNRGQMKLAGRNIQTWAIGIPDSGSGSMVTLLKVKSGYDMLNTDADTIYPDIWMVSGPGDLYNND